MLRSTTTLVTCLALSGLLVGCDTGAEDDPLEEPTDDPALTSDTVTGPASGADRSDADGPARIALDSLSDAGSYLTDADGMALYLFTADSEGETTCYDACADKWPPLTTSGEPATEAPDLRENLLGTIEREDGSMQVTYAGHPLYYYASDSRPGDTTGQDVHDSGGEWYLVTPEGTELEAEDDDEGGPA